MPEKDPTNWSLATWLLATGMACAGGLVNWYARVRRGHTRAFNLVELIGEMFTSGFVGLGVFMVADGWLALPLGVCAAGAGIGGHMATRLLFILERVAEEKIGSLAKGKK